MSVLVSETKDMLFTNTTFQLMTACNKEKLDVTPNSGLIGVREIPQMELNLVKFH